MTNFRSYFKKVFSKLELSPNLEIKPYRDWKISLIVFFVILIGVFWGHYWLYQKLINRSEISIVNNLKPTNPSLEWQKFKTTYSHFEQRTKKLNDLLIKSNSRIDPSR